MPEPAYVQPIIGSQSQFDIPEYGLSEPSQMWAMSSMTSRVALVLDFSREDSVSMICSLSVAGILIILLLI